MMRLRLWWWHDRPKRTPDAAEHPAPRSYPYAESGDWALVDSALRSSIAPDKSFIEEIGMLETALPMQAPSPR